MPLAILLMASSNRTTLHRPMPTSSSSCSSSRSKSLLRRKLLCLAKSVALLANAKVLHNLTPQHISTRTTTVRPMRMEQEQRGASSLPVPVSAHSHVPANVPGKTRRVSTLCSH